MLQKKQLSILIPSYNNVCTGLVEELSRQAESLVAQGLCYEILVADDGSDDATSLGLNERINTLPCSTFIKHTPNVGRARIRNFLLQQSRYQWLLFIDSDMTVYRHDFLSKYLSSMGEGVVYGGVSMDMADDSDRHNLRYIYELCAESDHTTDKRMAQPYHHFHTANFLVARGVMLAHPFDQRFRNYGYEDVLLGKQLKRDAVSIQHIDNPVSFQHFENNLHFVEKTEEGLRTLWQFHDELAGYNAVLDLLLRLPQPIRAMIRLMYRTFGPAMRRNLAGKSPWLTLFNIYKLGYLATISKM